MRRGQGSPLWALAIGFCWTTVVAAQNPSVRYYEQDGLTYRETKTIVERPVRETRYEERERTIYRVESNVQMQKVTRQVPVAVPDVYYQTRWIGRWNPFIEPYPVQVQVPYTRYEWRQQEIQVPIDRPKMVPVTQKERIPIPTTRMVQEEFIQRVVVGPAGTSPAPGSTGGRREEIVRDPQAPRTSAAPLPPGTPVARQPAAASSPASISRTAAPTAGTAPTTGTAPSPAATGSAFSTGGAFAHYPPPTTLPAGGVAISNIGPAQTAGAAIPPVAARSTGGSAPPAPTTIGSSRMSPPLRLGSDGWESASGAPRSVITRSPDFTRQRY